MVSFQRNIGLAFLQCMWWFSAVYVLRTTTPTENLIRLRIELQATRTEDGIEPAVLPIIKVATRLHYSCK